MRKLKSEAVAAVLGVVVTASPAAADRNAHTPLVRTADLHSAGRPKLLIRNALGSGSLVVRE
ncbi:hypothetical protein [Streptomyces sp. AK02-04a]|uniref:hypothetical protein n=1 Tax=Streptomyces sp. AK02-04a TaxID=3028649 RepID=UPI0029AF7173|nr:hypothetical protein [Streptomyces sp. AK02-04a]MDX3763584.1 hypothetical protein [Streptomyces sp. AK02-04a]